MLEMFEKLINEHGSSTILRERLELFSDKYAILEDKLEALSQKNSALEAENQSLRAQLEQAQNELEQLRNAIAANSSKSCQIDEDKQNILKILFEANTHATISQLASHLKINESVIQYHIDALKEGGLIDFGPLRINSPITYAISKEGRRYVVEEIGI